MLTGHIIRKAMSKRGYSHRRTDDQFVVGGQYARNLQYVYSKETPTRDGLVVDLIYFGVDILEEKLVIGFYRENTDIEDGVYTNVSRSISLTRYSRETLEKELDKLISPIRKNI